VNCYSHTKIWGVIYPSRYISWTPTWISSDNLGAVSDEHGERFYQDISALEKRYQGQRSARMLSDYSWAMKRDVPDAKHRRKSTTPTF